MNGAFIGRCSSATKVSGALASHDESVIRQKSQRALHRAEAQAGELRQYLLGRDSHAGLPAPVGDHRCERIVELQILRQAARRILEKSRQVHLRAAVLGHCVDVSMGARQYKAGPHSKRIA